MNHHNPNYNTKTKDLNQNKINIEIGTDRPLTEYYIGMTLLLMTYIRSKQSIDCRILTPKYVPRYV